MGNASGKANRTHAKRTHAKRTHAKRTHKRKGGAKPSPLGKGYTSPHDEMGTSLGGVTPSKRRKRTKKQPPLLPSVLIREALKLGTPPIKSIAPASKKINRNFKVTVTTSSASKHKSI